MSEPGPALAGDVVRLARPDEVERLPEIERRAAERFRGIGLVRVADGDPLSVALLRTQLERGRLWVAVHDDVVVGFAAAGELDGNAHLIELSVVPEHAGRALGRRLLREVLFSALRSGHPALTLRTFDDVPWNRPYYERLGFQVFQPNTPGWRELSEQERRAGLPVERRVAMCRDLTPRALRAWGWSAAFERRLAELDRSGVPARVILESRGQHTTITAAGEVTARVAGRLKRSRSDLDQPAIGDWVLLDLPRAPNEDARIEHVLRRQSCFERKVAGARTDVQVVAANVDHVLVVMGLDGDFNPRRLERYLVTAHRSGAEPVVVLNKADCAEDLERQQAETEALAGDAPVHVTAAKTGQGVDALRRYLVPGDTLALVGSSGVGKSTLVNTLYGEPIMRTRKVREKDERGQHTTTHRQLVRLPNGCLLIDNPGIRELQLWEPEEGLERTFPDIAEIAERCRFRDCRHEGEPGCAVAEAVERGELPGERLGSYRSFIAEAEALERRKDEAAKLAEKQRWRTIHKAAKKHKPRFL